MYGGSGKMKEQAISIFDAESGSSLGEYKTSLEQVQQQLSKYGLTGNQSKVYIYLGKYGAKTAPEVCKALKLPRTETYHLLSALQNKGIVSATFQHPIQFTALPLDKAIWILVNSEKERVKSLEKMEGELSEIWKNIPTFDSEPENEEEKFQMLKGTNQIYSKITSMTDGYSDELLLLGSEKDFLRLYHADFLEPFEKSKKQISSNWINYNSLNLYNGMGIKGELELYFKEIETLKMKLEKLQTTKETLDGLVSKGLKNNLNCIVYENESQFEIVLLKTSKEIREKFNLN